MVNILPLKVFKKKKRVDDLFSKLGINESSDIEMHKNILLSLSEFIHIEGNHIKKKKEFHLNFLTILPIFVLPQALQA